MDDSAIIRDEVVELTKQILTKNKQPVKYKTFHILLASLLITIALLIAVSNYCYLIKYRKYKNIYCYFTSQKTN